MDVTPLAAPPVRFNRLLPYWAVLQTDFRQTAQSWVYRLWVILTVVGAGGSVAYRAGTHQEAGIAQSASPTGPATWPAASGRPGWRWWPCWR